jgi:hypothetical protein
MQISLARWVAALEPIYRGPTTRSPRPYNPCTAALQPARHARNTDAARLTRIPGFPYKKI